MEVLQIPSELEQMTALYRERKPRRVLEIGSWEGGTLRVWLTKGTPERVVAVDIEHRNPHLYPAWASQLTDLCVIEGDSQDEQVREQIRELGPYDWLFIDGDHDPEPALQDVNLALACAAPGALLLIHDIETCVQPNGYPTSGPREAFASAAEGRESWTYLDPEEMRWGHGIGVVQL